MHQEVKATLSPDTFEGVKFDCTKHLNHQFSIGHTISMGSASDPPSYFFRTSLIGPRSFVSTHIGVDGVLTARYQYHFSPSFGVKLSGALSEEEGHSRMFADVEYDGQDFSFQTRVRSEGVGSLSWLQSLSPELSAGFEALLTPLGAMGTVVGKYEGLNSISTAAVTTDGHFSCTYYHKVNDKVAFGAELVHSLPNGHSHSGDVDGVTVGYDINFNQARVQANVHSSGKISCLLEEKFTPAISFMLSGAINYATQLYSFGFGFVMQSS